MMEGRDDEIAYFSPSKRLKLDRNSYVTVAIVECDVSSSNDHLNTGDLQDLCLSNGGDSGFNDFTPPSSDMETSGLELEEPDSSTKFVSCPTAGHGETDNDGDDDNDDDDDGNGDNDDEDEDIGDADEVASTVSRLSGFSDLSDMSGQEWKLTAGPMSWLQRQMILGTSPRILLQQILPQSTKIPDHLDDLSLWKLIVQLINEPPRRRKLRSVNTFDDVFDLVRRSRRIIVLTGAGVSVSCGIPDFRSHDGIYARLAKDFPDLPDPQAMFDIQYFRRDPRPFYKFAKEIFPGLFQPSPCHRFIRFLEANGKLLRNYTQNIDTLEQIAGIKNVIECHGSFATASCLRCKHRVKSSAIREDIFNQTIPRCPKCSPSADGLAIMKPDIVFFGEGLSDEFHNAMNVDKDQCDLLIIIGSSLKVRPVALIPSSIPSKVPQILINRERLPHLSFDVELLGDCDVIINEMCRRLGDGWKHLCYTNESLTELQELPTSRSNGNPSKSSILSAKNCNDPCDSTPSYHHFPLSRECSANEADCIETLASSSTTCTVVKEQSPDSTVEKMEPVIDPQLPKKPLSISTMLPKSTYLFSRPNRYVFHGAEVHELETDTESDDEDDEDEEVHEYNKY